MIFVIFTIASTYVALNKLTHFILITTLRGRSFYYLNFIDRGLKVQRASVACCC